MPMNAIQLNFAAACIRDGDRVLLHERADRRA